MMHIKSELSHVVHNPLHLLVVELLPGLVRADVGLLIVVVLAGATAASVAAARGRGVGDALDNVAHVVEAEGAVAVEILRIGK